MVNPWNLLGLEVDADARSIKRRYAQLLKQTRPDDAPEAFQRLREAYEWALEWAGRAQDADEPTAVDEASTPLPFGNGQSTIVPSAETQRQDSDEQAWVRSLPDSCASLDDALLQSHRAGLETALEMELLRRCQRPGDQASEILRWGMDRLSWLTPWQADYLPLANMNGLAERLLDAELWMLRSQFEAGQERVVLESITQLMKQPWVQPFDRSSYLQQGILALLEGNAGWSLAFFDGVCQLFGWSEARGQIPCDGERWEQLCSRSDAMALRAELRNSLSEGSPASSSSRAAWLLLKTMSEGERRKLVDGFDDADWLACEALAWRIEQHDDVVDGLGVACQRRWRDWHPGSGWHQLYLLLWLGLCLVMFVLSSGASESPKDLAISVGVVAAVGTALLFVFRLLIKGWNGMVRRCVVFDVGISQRLMPERWVRGGSGLLLLRHIVPSAAFAALTANWAAGPIAPIALALTTFILCVQFLDVASRGGAPAAWLIRAWLLLVPLGKQILIWVLILAAAFVLSKMIIAAKQKEREIQPSNLLMKCLRPTEADREACDNVLQLLREQIQRSEQARVQKQTP